MKLTEKAEKAFAEFEKADIAVTDYLALRWEKLDNERFTDLQNRTRSGNPKGQMKAAEELIDMVKHLRTPGILDGCVAFAFSNNGEHERALDVRLQALPLTPTWHPNIAGQVIGNTGWQLQQLGDLDGAQKFYERALAWDPTNPFVLASIAEVCTQKGDIAKAWAIKDYLDDKECPADHQADLVKLLAGIPRPSDTKMYDPATIAPRKPEFRDWARLAACSWIDNNMTPKEKLRALALGAARQGQQNMARVYSCACFDEEWTGHPPRGPLEQSWALAINSFMGSRGGDPEFDDDVRMEAYDRAMMENDTGTLEQGMFEILPQIRVIVSEHLGTPEGMALLEEHSHIEEREGVCTQAPQDHGASPALYRLKRKTIGHQPLILIPQEGGAHPVFDVKLKKDEGLIMWATFPGLFSQEDAQWFDDSLQKAAALLAKNDPKSPVHRDDNGQTVQIILPKLKNPAAAAQAFSGTFGNADSRLSDLVIGLFTIPDGKKTHIPHALPDPRANQEGLGGNEWWDRSFDLSSPAPLPEPEDGPSFMMIQSSAGHIPEIRLMPEQYDDFRVVWDLADVSYRESGAREKEVRTAIGNALEKEFRGLPPKFFNRNADENEIDAIVFKKRNGYAFASLLLRPESVVHYPAGFRFREHEMFRALRNAARACGLAPVVHWSRSAGTWIFNLWENKTGS